MTKHMCPLWKGECRKEDCTAYRIVNKYVACCGSFTVNAKYKIPQTECEHYKTVLDKGVKEV